MSPFKLNSLIEEEITKIGLLFCFKYVCLNTTVKMFSYSNSAAADEGPVAAGPSGSSTIFATCNCEDTASNIHAQASDLTGT